MPPQDNPIVIVVAASTATLLLISVLRGGGGEATITSVDKLPTKGQSRGFLAGIFGRGASAEDVAVVNLASEELVAIPLQILDYINLKELGLSKNKLTSLPREIAQLTSLEVLKVAENQLAAVPPTVGQLTGLVSLDFSGNKLTALPAEIGQLSSLATLSAARNAISKLPDTIGQLAELKGLNVQSNQLATLPESIGKLTQLFLLGLKSNQLTSLPASMGGLTNLRELYLTDNKLTSLPESLSKATGLVKIQASHNKLSSLPASFSALTNLEMLRVANNKISSAPTKMLNQLPNLAWFSFAGNTGEGRLPAPEKVPPLVQGADLQATGEKLGEGASGQVSTATWKEEVVAVKTFEEEKTANPDGCSDSELEILVGMDHPNLPKMLAYVERPRAVVFKMVSGTPLAEKPVHEPLLRCRYTAGVEYTLEFSLKVAVCVASALAYLHDTLHTCHGDVYAHNVLVEDDGKATLVDMGAGFCYKQDEKSLWEAVDLRAFGILVGELLERLGGDVTETMLAEVKEIQGEARKAAAGGKLTFKGVVDRLQVLSMLDT